MWPNSLNLVYTIVAAFAVVVVAVVVAVVVVAVIAVMVAVVIAVDVLLCQGRGMKKQCCC